MERWFRFIWRSSKKELEFKVLQGMKLFKTKAIKIQDNREQCSQRIGSAIILDVEILYQFMSYVRKLLNDFLGIVQMAESIMGKEG